MSSSRKWWVLVVLIAVGLLPAGRVVAQTQEEGETSAVEDAEEVADDAADEVVGDEPIGEEITVTALQVEESLREVTASVTVLTEGQLESAGVKTAAGIVKMVPGVSIVDAAEVADTQVNIRGINGSRDAENSYALVVDGILKTNPAALSRQYNNLTQVEVLKGPQGALYGRNAAAGAVIVSTKRPTEELEGDFKFTGAQDSTYFAGASVSGPIGASGTTGYVINAEWAESDGFFRNEFLGNAAVVDPYENYTINGRLMFEPNEDTTWDFQARYGEVEAGAITFNAAFALPSFTFIPLPGAEKFYEDVNDHSFVFQPNIVPQNNQDALELSGLLEKQLAIGRLTTWILYSDINNDFYADGTSGAFGFFNTEPNCRATTAELSAAGVVLPAPQILAPVPEFSIFGPYSPTTCDGTQYQVRNQEDISFQVQLAGGEDTRLRWQGGVYYLNIDREVGVNLGIDQQQGVVKELFVPQSGSNPTEQLVHDNFKSNVYAVFGGLRYDVVDNFELGLALRYDREDRDVTNLVPTEPRTQYVDFTLDGQFTGNAPLNPGLDPSINPSGQILPKSETFDELQPKITGRWDFTDRWSLYGSWGVGFKSGGFNNQGSNATVEIFYNQPLGTDLLIEDQFGKETSSAFELGLKADATDSLYIEGALYRVDVDDMQFFEFLVGPFGLLRVVSNIDEVQITGAEVGFYWTASNHFTLYGGWNWTDSEIIKNASRPSTVGNKSPYTPDYTGTLAVDMSYPVGGPWVLTGNLLGSFVGPTWFHTVQDQTNITLFELGFPSLGTADYGLTERDAYATLDFRIGLLRNQWSVTVWGTNITNNELLEEVIVAPEFGGSFIHPAALRRWGVDLGFRF
ncbi:MAG: TonB-dependent receptor [Acidobacteriota bacterium]